MKNRPFILGAITSVVLAFTVTTISSYLAVTGDYGVRTTGTEPLTSSNVVILRLGDHGMGYVFMRYGDHRPLPVRWTLRDHKMVVVHPLLAQDNPSWWPWLRRGDCFLDFERQAFGLRLTGIHPADASGAIPRDEVDNRIEYLGKRLFSWLP